MIVSFTGTQAGMTPSQEQAVIALVEKLAPKEAHHGDCIGADFQFHGICQKAGIPVHLHPCTISWKRAYCCGAVGVAAEKPPLDRNKDIVRACECLIATPKDMEEELRSGTWSTVRFARRRSKTIFIVFPDGSVKEEVNSGNA